MDTGALIVPGPVERAGVRLEQAKSIDLRVVLLFPTGQGDKLLGHGGGHAVAVDGNVLPGKEDLVLAVGRDRGFGLQIQAVLVATFSK